MIALECVHISYVPSNNFCIIILAKKTTRKKLRAHENKFYYIRECIHISYMYHTAKLILSGV